MKAKRRGKPKDDGRRVTDKGRIPNAEEVARSLMEPEVAIYHAVERGRTIGRLECMAEACEKLPEECAVTINHESRRMLLPILRAEIERLRAL